MSPSVRCASARRRRSSPISEDAAAAAADAALTGALRGGPVLIAYGLLGEVVTGVGLDYMGAQAAWLRHRLGAETTVVRLPTAAPVEDNATRLAAVLLAQPQPALLIGHSKGGLEALAALLRPGVAARCRAFVAIQAPFHGSPVADALCAVRPLHRAAGGILRVLRLGSGEGLRDLTTAARGAWMTAHAKAVAALVCSLPILCCASAVPAGARGPEARYRPLARWMERRGAGPNDGLVPVRSALLPGARQMVVEGSHRGLVATGRGRDPVGVLRQALSLALLDRPPDRPSATA